jgi:hypothetical protein
VQFGVRELLSTTAELSVKASDAILDTAPSPAMWPSTIDVVGLIDKLAQFYRALQAVQRSLFGRVNVKFDVRFLLLLLPLRPTPANLSMP